MFSTLRQRTIAVYHFLKAHRPHLGVFVFVSVLFLAGYLSAGIYASNTGNLSILSPQVVLAEGPAPTPVPASTPAAASAPEVGILMGWIIGLLLAGASLMLRLAIFCLAFIIQIAGYNGYLSSTAVNVGWVMVRDITNMFFVVILLLVAFGTILGLEQYEWKKMLVKFFLAAVLVNFSRIICGVIIDVGQVVMITFVNGIAATAGGNLINAFSMDKIFSLSQNSSSTTITDTKELFIAAVAAITFSAIILAMMLVFVFMLTARLIVLWILIVLSPFAFVLSVIPQTQKFASQWWSEFGNHVVVGPAVVFFMWLSFAVVGSGQINAEISGSSATPENAKIGDKDSAGIGDVMDWNKMSNFAIAIGILLVGAKTAQSLGTIGGSAMSKATDFGKKVAMVASGASAAMWAGGKAKQGAIASAKWAAMSAPLVGGQAWQRRGLAVKDKLLQGAEWYNKKIGSKLGFGLQFGHHEKMMKERQAAIEVRKGNLSSSVKGFQGWGLEKEKYAGSVEEYRAYVDNIAGRQAATKEGSEALRAGRKAAGQREILTESQELRDKYATRIATRNIEEAKLATEKAEIELQVVTGKLAKGKEGELSSGERLVTALAERNVTETARSTQRDIRMKEKSEAMDIEGVKLIDQSRELESLESAIEQLGSALKKLEPENSDALATMNSLPVGLADEIRTTPDVVANMDNPGKLREVLRKTITESLVYKNKEYQDTKLKFGDIALKVGGDPEKQLKLLEAIQQEIAKDNKIKGSGYFEGILKKFDAETAESVGFGAGKNLDRDFVNKNQGRNLDSAVKVLKDMQKGANKKPLTIGQAVAAESASRIEVVNRQKRELSGTIDLSMTRTDEQTGALAGILKALNLPKDKVEGGNLNQSEIAEASRRLDLNDSEVNSNLSKLGVTAEAIKKLIGGLSADKPDENVKRYVQNIMPDVK